MIYLYILNFFLFSYGDIINVAPTTKEINPEYLLAGANPAVQKTISESEKEKEKTNYLINASAGSKTEEISGRAPESKTVSGKTYTIKLIQDGTDQTATLQNQIDAVPDGTKDSPNIIQFPKGRFWTEGVQDAYFRNRTHVTRLQGKKNIIIEAEGTTFYTKAPSVEYGGNVQNGEYSYRRHFQIIDCENLTVNGLTIEGSNYTDGNLLGTSPEFTPNFWKGGPDNKAIDGFPAYQSYWEFEHGFDIKGGKNITLNDCHVYAVWGDGFYIGGGSEMADGINIIYSSADRTGRQGIAAANSAKNIFIDDFTLTKGRRSGIDLEPHSAAGVLDSITIVNSKIESQLTPFAAGGRGKIDNVHIENNKFSGSGNTLFCRTSHPSDMFVRKNWKFIGNERINRRGGDAIKLAWMDNVEIRDNKDSYSGDYYVSGLFVRNLTVVNNEVKGNELLRMAGSINVVTDFKVKDNSTAIPDDQVVQYEQIKLKNPL